MINNLKPKSQIICEDLKIGMVSNSIHSDVINVSALKKVSPAMVIYHALAHGEIEE